MKDSDNQQEVISMSKRIMIVGANDAKPLGWDIENESNK